MPLQSSSEHSALRMERVERSFQAGRRHVRVLDGLELEVGRGERVAIMGASGSGKSTLLNLAAGMDRPDHGQVELMGQSLNALAEPALTRFRARQVGLVFQDFNLIDSLTVRENIALPLWLARVTPAPTAVAELTETLGITALLDQLPGQLSGGERQRVAIARALVHRPALLLADEPTGSLDEGTAARVLRLFDAITTDLDCALVLVTHNPEAAAICDRRLRLQGGKLLPDS